MRSALETFLSKAERRAFMMARIATGNESDALDIVQIAMMRLVEKYAGKAEAEWPPLFQCILQSCINDWYRRQNVRNRWRVWLKQDEAFADVDNPLENQASEHDRAVAEQLDNLDFAEALEQALTGLPIRQKQAFMLRAWEGCRVKETAQLMKCSEGSVKTHYARALKNLRGQLKAYDHE